MDLSLDSENSDAGFFIRCMPSDRLIRLDRKACAYPSSETATAKPLSTLLQPFATRDDCTENDPMVLTEMKKTDEYLKNHTLTINHPDVIQRIADYTYIWAADLSGEHYRPFPSGNTPDGSCYVNHSNLSTLLHACDVKICEDFVADYIREASDEERERYGDGQMCTADSKLNAWRVYQRLRAMSQVIYTVDNYFGMEGLTAKLYTYQAAIIMLVDPQLLAECAGDGLFAEMSAQLYTDIYKEFGLDVREIEQHAASLEKSLDELADNLAAPFVERDHTQNADANTTYEYVVRSAQ